MVGGRDAGGRLGADVSEDVVVDDVHYRQIYANAGLKPGIGINMPITKRDEIWMTALMVGRETESEAGRDMSKYGIVGFTVEHVQDEIPRTVADRTVRDCLHSMFALGVLSKRNSNPCRYRLKESWR